MKLKNNALQELYDTLVNGTISFSPYAESPVAKAFRECDEKLQKDIDIWKRSNEILLSANADLVTNERKLEKEIEELQKHIDIKNHLENEFRKLKEHVLENHKIIANVSSERDALEKERDDLLSRAHCAEDEVMELKATLEKANTDRTELQNDRDYYHGLYTELRKDYDKLFEENKRLSEQIKTLKEFNSEITSKSVDIATYEMLNTKYRELLRRPDYYAKGYSDGKEEGEENLWSMLQNVRDVKPEEFDCECETLGDILDMDLEDFLDAYKKWEEMKEIKYMRDYLERFCMGRLCYNCPLHTKGFKCSRGKWLAGIPDEDIKRYYEKARSRGREKNKEAYDAFRDGLKAGLASEVKEVPVSCDIPIKNLASWECTLEAKVEINKDLLEKVCGIKPDDK